MSPSVKAYGACLPQDSITVDGLSTEALRCCDDIDPDFQDFITELGRSPLSSLSQPAESSVGAQPFLTVPQSGTECYIRPDKLAALQDFGLRSSPASTNKRKRQYSSTGDLAHLSSKLSWDTDSSGDSDRTTSANKKPTMPIKRASSSSLACTLMPFSLVKAFPNQDAVSLSDVNRRIQSVAEGEGVLSFQSQGSVSSLSSSLLPSNFQPARSPFRPQIRVVTQYGSVLPDTSPSPPYSFASMGHYP